jgi:hypothetical protein
MFNGDEASCVLIIQTARRSFNFSALGIVTYVLGGGVKLASQVVHNRTRGMPKVRGRLHFRE